MYNVCNSSLVRRQRNGTAHSWPPRFLFAPEKGSGFLMEDEDDTTQETDVTEEITEVDSSVGEAPESASDTKPGESVTLTREELAELLNSVETKVTSAIEKANYASKQRTREVAKRVKDMEELLKSSNVPVTDETRAAIRSQVEKEIPGDDQDNYSQEGIDPQQAAQAIYNETQAIFKTANVTVDGNDPEWKGIQQVLDDPNGNIVLYRQAVYDAVAKKRSRLEKKKETASARVTSGEGRTSQGMSLDGLDSSELYTLGDKMLREGKKIK